MKRVVLLLTVVTVLLGVALAAFAAVPPMINYQGKLLKPDGTAVADGTYSMRFAIYEDAATAEYLWMERNPAVQVKKGLFSVLLGSVNNLPANIFDSPNRFFGVTVGTDAEMTPRQQITTTAFAFKAAFADKATEAANGSPVGAMTAYAGSVAPTGWLLCDGRAVSRAEYAALFTAIGTAYGVGDGVKTFNLPDLRGRFPRGVDAGTGRDPDAASRTASAPGGNTGDQVGSVQDDALQGHWHTVNHANLATSGDAGVTAVVSNSTGNPSNCSLYTTARELIADGAHGTPRTSSETRPDNVAVNWIVKM